MALSRGSYGGRSRRKTDEDDMTYVGMYKRNIANDISNGDLVTPVGAPHKSTEDSAYTNTAFIEDEKGAAGVFTISDKQGQSEPSRHVHYKDDEEEEVEVDYDDEDPNCCLQKIISTQTCIETFVKNHSTMLKVIFYTLLVLLYFAYFSYAMYYTRLEDEDSVRLLWVTCAVVVFSILYTIHSSRSEEIADCFRPCTNFFSRNSVAISWVFVTLLIIGIVTFIFIDILVIKNQPYNLVSGGGIIIYIFLLFIFSHDPSKIKWRPVVWGVALQFALALIILRWSWGYLAFEWLGDRVSEFLEHTDAGSIFVFGDSYEDHFFAFKVLPVVIFFSTVISTLYYLGCMQFLIRNIAAVMQACMGTTAAESINAAGNIFVGQTEAPLIIRPMIHDMTRSEIHAVMTGGFATIAGTVMGAFIFFGVPANHLLSASVMSAPAALAMAKLSYPEVEKSKTTAEHVQKMEDSPERTLIEAASAGASNAIVLVANIGANLIAFVAVLHFLNATLTWFGDRVGVEGVTFEFLCSYALWPFALVMGIELPDCRKVAELIGVKTFLNEFIAYEYLGDYIRNRENLTWYEENYPHQPPVILENGDIYLHPTDVTDNYTLVGGILTDRSQVISTYALCGFANFGSIGVVLGALGAMAPERKPEMATLALRAMVAGNVACFITACIAGLLYQDSGVVLLTNATTWNDTIWDDTVYL